MHYTHEIAPFRFVGLAYFVHIIGFRPVRDFDWVDLN